MIFSPWMVNRCCLGGWNDLRVANDILTLAAARCLCLDESDIPCRIPTGTPEKGDAPGTTLRGDRRR
jgi:hypothetical protein